MKFHEIKEGMVIRHDPVVIDQEEILEFARRYDPQWFHTDVEKAEQGRWGGLIGSGWLTCGLAMRMTYNAVLHDSEAFGSPGVDNLRWLLPIRPGDALRLENTVDSVRKSESKPDLGIVRWTWRMYNQNEEQVLQLEVTSFFDLTQS